MSLLTFINSSFNKCVIVGRLFAHVAFIIYILVVNTLLVSDIFAMLTFIYFDEMCVYCICFKVDKDWQS